MKKIFNLIVVVSLLVVAISCKRIVRDDGTNQTTPKETGAAVSRPTDKDGMVTVETGNDVVAQTTSNPQEPKPTQTLHVFIENSGSMNGYINTASDFQSAIGKAIQFMKYQYNSDKINVYYINQRVYNKALPEDISINEIYSFIQKMLQRDEFTTSGTHQTGSGTASTDLNDIIKQVLRYVDENNTAIFISDCIYSLKSTNGVTTKLLNDCKTLTLGAFLDKTKTLPSGVTLATNFIQLNSNFKGNYWNWEHPTGNKYVTLNCKRPYYICVVGTDENVKNFNSKINIPQLDGFQNQFTISNKDVSDAKYSVMYGGQYKLGSYRVQPETNGLIHTISRVKPNSVKQFVLGVAIDLDDFAMSETDKEDLNNYSVDYGNYSIVKIEKIDSTKLTTANDKQLFRNHKFTHTIVLSCTGFPNDFAINIKWKIPEWVKSSSSIDDRNIGSDIEEQGKTFGLSYFVEGIADAYNYIATDKKNFMTIKVKVTPN